MLSAFNTINYLISGIKLFLFIQEEPSGIGGALLKPHPTSPPPDMSPFFLRQYVKVRSVHWKITLFNDGDFVCFILCSPMKDTHSVVSNDEKKFSIEDLK